MNLYGFKRITTGADRGAYYHELFLYGRPDLIQKITRIRIKGTGCKAVSSPETEPNFYTQYYSCLENTVGNRDDDNTGENGRAMSTSESRDQHQPEPIFVNGYSCIRSCQVPNEKENIKSTGAGDDSGVGDSFSLLKTIKQFPQPTMSGFFASPPPLPQASAFCTLEPVGSYPQDFSQHSDNAMQGQQNEDLTPYPLSSGRSNLNSIQDEVISLMSDIGYGGTDSGGHGDENFATFSSEFASMDPLFMLEDSFPTETL